MRCVQTYAWRNGIPQKPKSHQSNSLGRYVTQEHRIARGLKVLYLLPRSNVATLGVTVITGNGGGKVE